jgi:hypothetical protein
VRQNRRVLVDFVFRFGGSETLKTDADLDKFIPLPEFKGWKVMLKMWPHDIMLRTNMSTSVWQDMPAMVAFRDASVLDKDGAGVSAAEFLRMLADLEDDPRHRLLSVGVDDLRLPEDGAAVAVYSRQLHLSMWKACASELSVNHFRLQEKFLRSRV